MWAPEEKVADGWYNLRVSSATRSRPCIVAAVSRHTASNGFVCTALTHVVLHRQRHTNAHTPLGAVNVQRLYWLHTGFIGATCQYDS